MSGLVASKQIVVPSFASSTSLNVRLLPGVMSPAERTNVFHKRKPAARRNIFSEWNKSNFIILRDFLTTEIGNYKRAVLSVFGCARVFRKSPTVHQKRKTLLRRVNSATRLRSSSSLSYSKLIGDSGQITRSILSRLTAAFSPFSPGFFELPARTKRRSASSSAR